MSRPLERKEVCAEIFRIGGVDLSFSPWTQATVLPQRRCANQDCITLGPQPIGPEGSPAPKHQLHYDQRIAYLSVML